MVMSVQERELEFDLPDDVWMVLSLFPGVSDG